MESNLTTAIGQNANPKYHFSRALRPFSLPVSLVTCGLGVTAGHQLQTINSLTALLVLFAGLLLQAGVNLINDHADLKNNKTQQHLTSTDCKHINFNYRIGWLCFTLCAAIGLFLTYQTSLFLFILAIIGGCGALFYTTEPIHYKRRGLGVVLVFFLMGVLMVYGACFAVTGIHYFEAITLSIPVSFLASALLLSNELRDYASDKNEDLKTLTVRIGLDLGRKLYATILILGFASASIIITHQQLWLESFIFIPSFLLSIHAAYIAATKTDLKILPPITGRLYLVFGISEIILLMI